jgi:hypothetical protein
MCEPARYQYEIISKAIILLPMPFSLVELPHSCWKCGITSDGCHIIINFTLKAVPLAVISQLINADAYKM